MVISLPEDATVRHRTDDTIYGGLVRKIGTLKNQKFKRQPSSLVKKVVAHVKQPPLSIILKGHCSVIYRESDGEEHVVHELSKNATIGFSTLI